MSQKIQNYEELCQIFVRFFYLWVDGNGKTVYLAKNKSTGVLLLDSELSYTMNFPLLQNNF